VVDEADRLKQVGLEQLRDLYDRRHIGLVLIGMPGLQKRLARYAQLYSRVGFVHQFQPLSGREFENVVERQWVQLQLDSAMDPGMDAAVLNAPGKFKAKGAGLKEVLFLGEQVYALSGGVATSVKIIQSRPETVQRFVTAAVKGLIYFSKHREGSIPIMAKYMKVDNQMAKDLYETTIQTFTQDGTVDESFMKSEAQLQADVLGLKEPPPFDLPFDLSFARKANRRLKNWKPQ